MQFESFAAALAMDGHGVYVWTVVAVSAAIVTGLLLVPHLASRRFLRTLRSSTPQVGRRDPEVRAPTAVIEEVRNAPGA
jgi:heme exporter protein CcmD